MNFACCLCGSKGSSLPAGSDGGASRPPVCDACLDLLSERLLTSASHAGQLDEVASLLESYGTPAPFASRLARTTGLALAELGHYDRAISYLHPLLAKPRQSTSSVDPLLGQVYVRHAIKIAPSDPQSASLAAAEAMRLAPGMSEARRLVAIVRDMVALQSVHQGRIADAIKLWEESLAQSPLDLSLLHQLAILYYRYASELEAANQASETGRKRGSERAPASHELWRKAIAYWATLLYSPAFWSRWRRERSKATNIHFTDEDLEEARRALQEKLLQEFRDAASHFRSAEQPEQAKRFAEYETLWALETKTAEITSACLPQYQFSGWPEGLYCGPLMLDLLAANPKGESLAATLRQASSSFQSQNQGGDDNSTRLRLYLSRLGKWHFLLDEGRFDDVIAELSVSSETRPLFARAYSAKGNEWAEVRRWKDALDAFDKARSFGSDLSTLAATIVEAGVTLAREMLAENSGNLDQAIKTMELCLRLVPNAPELKENLAALDISKAYSLGHLGNPDEAVRLAREARRICDSAEALDCLCSQLFQSGKTIETEKGLREGIERFPDRGEFRQHLVQILHNRASDEVKRGAIEQSLATLQEAVTYDDTDSSLDILVQALFACDRQHQAVNLLAEKLQEDPDNEAVRRNLSAAAHNQAIQLLNQNLYDQGIDWLRYSLSTSNDNQGSRDLLTRCLLGRANASYRVGRKSAAITDLQEASRLDPSNSDVREMMRVLGIR